MTIVSRVQSKAYLKCNFFAVLFEADTFWKPLLFFINECLIIFTTSTMLQIGTTINNFCHDGFCILQMLLIDNFWIFWNIPMLKHTYCHTFYEVKTLSFWHRTTTCMPKVNTKNVFFTQGAWRKCLQWSPKYFGRQLVWFWHVLIWLVRSFLGNLEDQERTACFAWTRNYTIKAKKTCHVRPRKEAMTLLVLFSFKTHWDGLWPIQ